MAMPELKYDGTARLYYVWLVWGVTKDLHCDLVAIASDDAARERYLEAARRSGRYTHVQDEKAFIDHMFGETIGSAVSAARIRKFGEE